MRKLEFVEDFEPQARWDGNKYYGEIEKTPISKTTENEGDYDYWFGLKMSRELSSKDNYLAIRGGWNGTKEVYLKKEDFNDFVERETISIIEDFKPVKCFIPGANGKLGYFIYAKLDNEQIDFDQEIVETFPENVSDYVQIKGISGIHVVYTLKQDAPHLIACLRENNYIHVLDEENVKAIAFSLSKIACG